MPPSARCFALIVLTLTLGGHLGCSTGTKSSDVAIWLVKDGSTYEPTSNEYRALRPQLAVILAHHRRMTGEPFVLSDNPRTADYIARVEVEADGSQRIQSIARNPRRSHFRTRIPITAGSVEPVTQGRHPSLELAEQMQRHAESRPFDSDSH